MQTRVHVFPAAALAERRAQAGGAPVCWMWCELARLAFQAFAPEWTLLLGDDVILEPGDWHARLAGEPPCNCGTGPSIQCMLPVRCPAQRATERLASEVLEWHSLMCA